MKSFKIPPAKRSHDELFSKMFQPIESLTDKDQNQLDELKAKKNLNDIDLLNLMTLYLLDDKKVIDIDIIPKDKRFFAQNLANSKQFQKFAKKVRKSNDATETEKSSKKTLQDVQKLQEVVMDYINKNRKQLELDVPEELEAPNANFIVLVKQEEHSAQVTPRNSPTKLPKIVSFDETPIERALREGLSPLYLFVGQLAMRLGDGDDRHYYKFKNGATLEELQCPIVKGAKDIKEFIKKNSHLGRALLAELLSETKATKGFALLGDALEDELDFEALLNEGRSYNWVFGLAPDTLFAYILHATTMGAMITALEQIRSLDGCGTFTLRQILQSEHVRGQFALFCAFHFLGASGGNAYGNSRVYVKQGKVAGTGYNLSAGLETRKRLALQMEACQYWFQDVVETANTQLEPLRIEKQRLWRMLPQELQIDDYKEFKDFLAKENSIDRPMRRMQIADQSNELERQVGNLRRVNEEVSELRAELLRTRTQQGEANLADKLFEQIQAEESVALARQNLLDFPKIRAFFNLNEPQRVACQSLLRVLRHLDAMPQTLLVHI